MWYWKGLGVRQAPAAGPIRVPAEKHMGDEPAQQGEQTDGADGLVERVSRADQGRGGRPHGSCDRRSD